ncbi:MAG TPA: type 4a pilus biogenesis protein PilO [Candidatus Acidoferrum sp.]|jgi:type IV pilus assembly protein PilO
MANPLRDMSVIMQGLVAAAIAVVLVLVGIYLPFSPVAQEKDQVDKAVQTRTALTQEVTQLQVYKQRFGELKQEMDALNKQLDTLKTIVPEEKETDEFIRLLQGAATASNVAIRSLKAKAVVSKDNNYYEMPFEISADGPYFNVLDFFGRLSRLSRIINVGDLQFSDPEKSKGGRYTLRPGSTVGGVFTATTYFTKPGDVTPAAGAAKPGAKN